MDKARRDALRTVINKARREVEESLARQLSAYGLSRDSSPIAHEDLTLRPEQEQLFPRLLEAVKRHGRAVGAEGQITPQAVGRFIRETGGTWINRLAALRALETRGLLEPAAAFISDEYGGGSPRAALLREAAAASGRTLRRDEALTAGIEDACRELSVDVRVLFDLQDEQSLLWPDTSALKEILGLFSVGVPPEDWQQPDVLGWVYQYYNTEANAELKKRKAKTTGFKYSADDIPIANQFYTPHWVVRVLTDNTLGRLWLEGRERAPLMETIEPAGGEGEGKGKPTYRLLERRAGIPHAAKAPEPFREWLNGTPDPVGGETVDRLCRFLVPLPSTPIPRPRKPAREIRVIDLACGSGHFLLYAFDVLFAIYREDEPGLDPREIPALILQNNLFGIDIDLRAAQLAAFNLYLKARETLRAIDPAASLKLTRLNIVIADAHIGNDPRKAEFLARYKDDPEIQQLYAKVLEALDNTNALGSLIKVRTEFEGLFKQARGAREKQRRVQEEAWSPTGQMTLVDAASQAAFEEKFRSYSGREWSLDELLDELRAFESEVAPGQDIGARLFYADLERSVGLLSLLSQQYDVVLMNPPYGDMPPEAKDYCKGNRKKKISAHYPRTHVDLFAAFIEQSLDLLSPNGLLGALVPWTYTYLSTMEQVRKELLCVEARPEFVQEYGYGILDGATVGTVGTVARKLAPATGGEALTHACTFERVSGRKKDWEKEEAFRSSLPDFTVNGPSYGIEWFVAQLRSLQDVPGMPYAFWASDSLRGVFRLLPPLDSGQKEGLVPGRPKTKVADVRQGLATADDARFTRFWWEVFSGALGYGKRWLPFVKGGSHVRFYTRIDLVVNWEDDGREQRQFGRGRYQATGFYFRPGVTWPRAAWRIRRFGVFLAGSVFADKGPAIFSATYSSLELAALLNSAEGTAFLLMQTPERMWEVGQVAALPIPDSRLFPVALVERVERIVELTRAGQVCDETCIDFERPVLLDALAAEGSPEGRAFPGLRQLLELVAKGERVREEETVNQIHALDDVVFDMYGASSEDRVLVRAEIARRETGTLPLGDDPDGEAPDDERERGTADESEPSSGAFGRARRRDVTARWLSYYLNRTITADEDGIVPVASTGIEPSLLLRVRETIERNLGKATAQELVAQAPTFLGTKDLDEWLSASREEAVEVEAGMTKVPVGFFPWHVNLYRNRPIFWLLSSEGFERGKVRFTFRAYIHYPKLTADTLPRLLSHYLETAISWVDHEWKDASAKAASLEGKLGRSAAIEADDWLRTLDALRKFEKAVREVVAGPVQAERVSANAKWLPRTIAQVRGGQDLGRGYHPNVDFGVRVNIAPLVEKKLFPRIVLKKLGG